MMHRVRLELGPDNLQARTLTARLSCLDKKTVKKSQPRVLEFIWADVQMLGFKKGFI